MAPRSDTHSSIPVIDISASNAKAPQELLNAACRFGFVFIANNEAVISPELISKVFRISQYFFVLPVSEKQKVAIGSNGPGKNTGWLSQGIEKLDPKVQKRPDVKEAFNMSLPDQDGQFSQPLPPPIEQNLSTIVTFEKACYTLCQTILETFAIALNIPKDWFTTRHNPALGPVSSIFRLLYYPKPPPQPSPSPEEEDIRAGAHSDYGSITCLFQLPGQPGLEIKTPQGEWVPVPVDPLGGNDEGRPLPILVNIGDLLEDWTGGLLKSTIHRVVFPKEEAGDRFSIAYFCHPLDEALLEPVPSEIVKEYAKQHGRDNGRQDMTARDHLMERLAATYKIGES